MHLKENKSVLHYHERPNTIVLLINSFGLSRLYSKISNTMTGLPSKDKRGNPVFPILPPP